MSRRAGSSGSGGGRYVVAVDFGTTFSGFAFLQKSDPEQRIFKFTNWPDSHNLGGNEYCKTKTAVYYESDAANGTYNLVAWGWSALESCTEALELLQSSNQSSTSSAPEFCNGGVTSFKLAAKGGHDARFGCYVEQFKLDLLERPAAQRLRLPGDLTTERLVVDYLKSMGDLIMKELRGKYSNNLEKDAVEWCLTVPSIWDERAKQVMKVCAEKAGLVQGNECPNPLDASPHPLDIILEPEGASMYCQQQAKAELHLRKGDKLLIADVGGGTIDLVVHIKSEDDPNNTEVEEVVGSYGELGGGTFVDEAFFKLLAEKIGCFDAFCRNDPATRLHINKKWQGMKTGFHGGRHTNSLPIYGKLKKAWKEYDKRRGQLKDEDEDEDDYSLIMLKEHDFRRIFDSQVDKLLELISKHVRGVKVLMVVGGFAESAYLRSRVEDKFRGMVSHIVVPPEPGSAICSGAVQLHLRPATIQARIQRRTYGLEMARDWKKDDPKSLIIKPDGIFGAKLCSEAFDVFVKAGDRVPRNEFVVKSYRPIYPKQKSMQLNLYSTERKYPKFISEEGCKHEGGFQINIEKGMSLGRKRVVEVTMVFGASSLQVSAVGKNFGDGTRVDHVFPITFL